MPSGRTWQMIAALVAVAVMVVVLVMYGRGDNPPPKSSTSSAPQQHHTDDEPPAGDRLAPLQPFAVANVGDWIAIEQSLQVANDLTKVTRILIQIEALDEETVTIVRSERVASLEPPTVMRAKRPRRGLMIGDLVGNQPLESVLEELVITDEPHQIAGRTFACKKLAFTVMTNLGRTKFSTVEMWISNEVPVDGLVDMRQTFMGPKANVAASHRLVGFGSTGTVAWGSRPEGL